MLATLEEYIEKKKADNAYALRLEPSIKDLVRIETKIYDDILNWIREQREAHPRYKWQKEIEEEVKRALAEKKITEIKAVQAMTIEEIMEGMCKVDGKEG